jgi:hypothetical protein
VQSLQNPNTLEIKEKRKMHYRHDRRKANAELNRKFDVFFLPDGMKEKNG